MDAKPTTHSKTTGHEVRARLSHLSMAAEQRSWLPYAIILLAILVLSIVYLWPSPFEFPMDDTYIHFVYAQNLSERGKLFFNDPFETGVGTSSLLWVLILAAGNWVGLSMHWVAKGAGLISLSIVGIGLYYLLRPLLSTWASLAVVLLVTLSGHMLWFALSGMETVLFLALGILALLFYRREQWGWLGLALGLLAITRIEGVILALVIAGVDVWRYRSIRRGLWKTGALCGLICIPWIMYLWTRTGAFIPTSGIGRHLSNITAIQFASEQIDSLSWLRHFPWLNYPLTWIGYTIEFILGGFALPAPYLYIQSGLGPLSFKLSIWAIMGLLTVVLPLYWVSSKRLLAHVKSQGWEKNSARLPLMIFLFWVALHNLGYMIYLPIIGSASRYACLNHIALWVALGLGVWFARWSPVKYWLAAGLTLIALSNTVYWNRVYDANLDHMIEVRITAAEYLRDQIPEGEKCAAFDVGALRYYSQRPLVDLGALIDPGLFDWFLAGKSDLYLINNGVTCVAIPGRLGNTDDGVVDIARVSGLSQSNLYDLRQEIVFQIDRERWLLGYLPTINYQATVTIYRLADKKAAEVDVHPLPAEDK